MELLCSNFLCIRLMEFSSGEMQLQYRAGSKRVSAGVSCPNPTVYTWCDPGPVT